ATLEIWVWSANVAGRRETTPALLSGGGVGRWRASRIV
ncbi:MAG: hypothetical protein AVDCRST_MAG73-2885, partial [uncultured Thermomicrobiales bacterium]